MPPVLVTLNGLEGHSPVAGLFKCNLSNILCSILPDFNWQCARAVPERQLGFLSSSVKLHCYGRRTISGKLLAFGFVATMRLFSNYFDLLLLLVIDKIIHTSSGYVCLTMILVCERSSKLYCRPTVHRKTNKKPSCRWGTARWRGRASWNLVNCCANVNDLHLNSSETDEWPSSSFKVAGHVCSPILVHQINMCNISQNWVKKR